MLIVALAVVIAVAVGVVSERRTARAPALARRILQLMLYALVPFVSFVNIAHLRVTVAAGTGLVFAYLALGLAGAAAGYAGRRMRLSRPEIGALICSVILVNTGYLGLPMTVALIGPHQLGTAIAYDQLVSGPMLFIAGFGIGAAFGTRAGEGARARARSFFARNPPLLAVVAGLLASPALAPAPLVHASRFVVAALLPLGFFVVGVNLSAERREDGAPLLERPDRRVLTAVGLRLLVTPLLLATVSATIVTLPSAYLLQARDAERDQLAARGPRLRSRPAADRDRDRVEHDRHAARRVGHRDAVSLDELRPPPDFGDRRLGLKRARRRS